MLYVPLISNSFDTKKTVYKSPVLKVEVKVGL